MIKESFELIVEAISMLLTILILVLPALLSIGIIIGGSALLLPYLPTWGDILLLIPAVILSLFVMVLWTVFLDKKVKY